MPEQDGVEADERPDWSVKTVASLELTTNGEQFHLAIDLTAFHGARQIWQRRWEESIAREWA